MLMLINTNTKQCGSYTSVIYALGNAKLENQNWVFPTTSSCSPSNNCMNKWLGEPVLGNIIKNLVINNFQNQCIETSM